MNNDSAIKSDTENTPVTMTGVLICDSGKVLLVREDKMNKEDETYELPVGMAVENETLTDTAIRELYEQTGLMVTEDCLERLSKEYDSLIEYRGKMMQVHLVVFKCVKFDGGVLSMFGDWVTPEWVELKDIDKLRLSQGMGGIIKEILDTANI
jgi:ADP-ribose pyrophosphatase YjhB (NUDIX family)